METLHQETTGRLTNPRQYRQYPTVLAGEGRKLTKEEKEDLSRLVDDDGYQPDTSSAEEAPGTGTSLGNNDGTQTLPDSNDIGESAPSGNNFGERPPATNDDQERWTGRSNS
ncbi:hypothetical protein GCM10023189_50230 [Nibrella saemangeumensis]|uniref:Uncharacterized protein n=1 Tax=Nibrella saemangeumensis TaxID=1084526 RepID=A0ABP8NGT8_9BACT